MSKRPKRRVRIPLDDGAYLDLCISPDASQETLDALRAMGNAAAKRMREGTLPPSRKQREQV